MMQYVQDRKIVCNLIEARQASRAGLYVYHPAGFYLVDGQVYVMGSDKLAVNRIPDSGYLFEKEEI